MTYLELFHKIESMTMEQKMCDVTYYDNEDSEFRPLGAITTVNEMDDESDVLDPNHPYLF